MVFVADDLVYVVLLRGERVAAVAGDGKQDDRRVEDRAEPEDVYKRQVTESVRSIR